MLRLAWAFLERDWRNTSLLVSLGRWAQAVFFVAFWFFVIRFFRQGAPAGHGSLPLDYFTFGLVGLALSQYVWRGFSSFTNRLKNFQVSGELETLWLVPRPFLLLMVLFSVWDLVWATVLAATILGVGAGFFHTNLTFLQGVGILGIGTLVFISTGCYALLIASCNLALGYADDFRNLLSRGIVLASGTFFPVSVLPPFVKSLALLLPLTHALFLARRIAGSTQPLDGAIWIKLILLTVGLIFLASFCWKGAVRAARVSGRMTAA